MDSQLFNILFATIASTLSVKVASSVTTSFEWISDVFWWFYDYFMDMWYGPKYKFSVSHTLYASYRNYSKSNNIVINAVLDGHDSDCKSVEVDNVVNDKDLKVHENDYSEQMSRLLRTQKCGSFEEDDIVVSVSNEIFSIEKTKGSRREPISKKTLYLESRVSQQHIMDFIERKRNAYIQKYKDDTNQLQIFNDAEHNNNRIMFFMSPFVSRKTFNTCFFPQKNEILELISHFECDTGPFGVAEKQKKMTFLLHGIPGCGKTSFIKALANRLKRHIVSVSLAKCNSLQAFREIFFRNVLHTPGYDKLVPIKRRIIIFEEIDTAGPIVMDRQKIRNLQNERNYFHSIAQIPYFMKIADQQLVKKMKNINHKDEKNEGNEKDDSLQKAIMTSTMESDSPITLGDILTILDGVTELQDFVCVMTTNHKEVLDPALIRPGRVTKEIEFSHMASPEISEFLRYYYSIPNDKENDNMMVTDISEKIHKKYTASQVESILQKFDSLQDLHSSYCL